jgi:D-alanyl-D-alanine carboxypeptidase (penicillin-binding protein 5/6)
VLIVLALVLGPAVAGGDQAGAQETTSGQRAASQAAVPTPPKPSAEAWALTDADSGLYLAGENPDEQLSIGSTTKIMTALEILGEGTDPDEEITVPKEAEAYVGNVYSNVGLIAGERLTVGDLLEATLIPSGTDAAYTLAEDLGGGSVDNFVEKMNDRASSMGLKNTHFDTPAGLDTPGNYSSARDLATMASAALKYPLFAEIVDTKDATINTQNRTIELHNTNQLLSSYPKATGVKTGTTPDAGANLVASAKDSDQSYIAVVLDEGDDPERFQDTRSLLDYGFNNYKRQSLVSQDEVYAQEPLPYRRGTSVNLAAEKDVAAPTNSSSQVERQVTAEDLPPEAEAGQELGEVEVFVDGQSAGSSPLVAQEGYGEASLWDKAWYYSLGWIWDKVSQIL